MIKKKCNGLPMRKLWNATKCKAMQMRIHEMLRITEAEITECYKMIYTLI